MRPGESSAIRQVAALPYSIDPAGEVRVLLITSRETRRWLIPKGNPIRGLAAHEAAAHEAFEEAGVSGSAASNPIGSYRYTKKRRDGRLRIATVEVFPLQVIEQAEDWPEQDERETRWFTPGEAATLVAEPELKALIAGFRVHAPVLENSDTGEDRSLLARLRSTFQRRR